ncbi:UPF0149 family protein [Pseudoalteromonas sp. PAR1]|uniref:UPF0149 family protein n=1 Tax=Pseudoalteromonas sp. PAR1 TaxID=2853443 RepID=UPI00248C573D|nr:UPF0149 family protein [Pseudoalteromonas sp. PAR1]
MFNTESSEVMKNYLASQSETNQVSLDQVIGFMAGLLACSEFFGESELANYIADNDESIFNTLMTDSEPRDAMIELLDNVTEAQVEQKKILAHLYSNDADANEPSQALQDFCSGYIAAYIVNQDIWHSDLQFLLQADEQKEASEEGQLFIDNFEATLDLLTTFAMWDQALANHPEPEKLGEGFATFFAALDESLAEIATMALMLEDEKLAMLEQDQ